ncbi:MAG: hypothetical protein GY801_52810 [bacterium]|nr:hypothetical protein [bacterium]
MLKELNYIEQWGSGIKRISSSCLAKGLQEPRIRETGDFVDVELYRENAVAAERVSESIEEYRKGVGTISEQERAIVEVLEEHSRIRSKEVQALLQVKEARARRILKTMVDKGILEKRGRGKNTYYVLM